LCSAELLGFVDSAAVVDMAVPMITERAALAAPLACWPKPPPAARGRFLS
jgi:hypothetical protein